MSDHDLPSPNDRYRSPLEGRYASDEMQELWSPRRKFETWRKIWLAVAEAQHELGLPVTAEQVAELRDNLDVTDDDIALASRYEADLRHDVMSHVHAWGDRCPKARGIIHLGMTSQDINCNTEFLLINEALQITIAKVAHCMFALAARADEFKALPTLGFTHYQPAQPTTVGRRFANWAYDLSIVRDRLVTVTSEPPFDAIRGLRGATGTQASYLKLFDDNAEAVDGLEAKFVFKLMGWEEASQDPFEPFELTVAGPEGERREQVRLVDEARNVVHRLTGQTYPRVLDAMVVSDLAAVAAVLHKIATDIRLLSNRKELDEPFAAKQVGSSAMPYKRNPMRCERICGLSRFVMNLVGNAYETAAIQWLERTLDDSSNRRLVLPEAFLGIDACLGITHNVASGMIVHEATVRKNLMAELPFMASENLLMEAVKLGRDRQEVHEAIRRHAQEAGRRVKDEGADNDLIERLAGDPLMEGVDLDAALDPAKYVGLAPRQTTRFIEEVIEPLREVLGDEADMEAADLKV